MWGCACVCATTYDDSKAHDKNSVRAKFDPSTLTRKCLDCIDRARRTHRNTRSSNIIAITLLTKVVQVPSPAEQRASVLMDPSPITTV